MFCNWYEDQPRGGQGIVPDPISAHPGLIGPDLHTTRDRRARLRCRLADIGIGQAAANDGSASEILYFTLNSLRRKACNTRISLTVRNRGCQESGFHVSGHDDQKLLLEDRRRLVVGSAVSFLSAALDVSLVAVAGELQVGAGEYKQGEGYEPQHRRQAAEEVRHRRVPRRHRGGRRRREFRPGGAGGG
ncbi:DNA-directed RNA polymerase II subunit RPB2 [Striga asiatica]|uniref:DNA-directed RNA polymerase II subunit RPB2 n=1 Tax=Striga asiatica TaxID=4170 RepID=A0A5A7Q4C4_STRAF|nr:DNA-directed RNA polymerase II subunit RPB2 [Striga asiatica]